MVMSPDLQLTNSSKGTMGPLSNGVVLPSLSPLAGRTMKPSLQLNDVTDGLQMYGFDTTLYDGSLQVTTPGNTLMPSSAPASASIEDFLGSMHKERGLGLGRSGYQRKFASSVVFSTAKSKQPLSASGSKGSKRSLNTNNRSAPSSPLLQPRTLSNSVPTSPASARGYPSTTSHTTTSILSASQEPPFALHSPQGWMDTHSARDRPLTAPSFLRDSPVSMQNTTRDVSTAPQNRGRASSGEGGFAARAEAMAEQQQQQQQEQQQSSRHEGEPGPSQSPQQQDSEPKREERPYSRAGEERPLSRAGGAPGFLAASQGSFTTGGPAYYGSNRGNRFHRLAKSVDSLQSLRVASGGGINASNMQVLAEPNWAPSFNSSTPLVSQQAIIEAQMQSTMSQAGGSTGQRGADQGDGVTDEAGGLTLQQQQHQAQLAAARPFTVDLHEGACASLAAAKQSAVNGEVHVAQRPFTARVGAGSSIAGGARKKLVHPMSGWRPTRGQVLQVYQHLDKDKNGKITMSEIEEVGLSLGFTLEQAQRLFRKVDRNGKGYLMHSDWGAKEYHNVVELFSLMYMQKFMGLPTQNSTLEQVGKYWVGQEMKQIKSMPAAIAMAKTNAMMRKGDQSYNQFILECFKFIDTENRGWLDVNGVRDGFSAMGVQLSEDVAMQIISKHGSEKFDYAEHAPKLLSVGMVFV